MGAILSSPTRVAALGLAVCFGLATALVVALVETPVRDRTESVGDGTIAAIAVRDHVVPFQQWGSKMFTLRNLERRYDEVHYFTQAYRGHDELAIVTAIEHALRTHDAVDVYWLAHSNRMVGLVGQLPPELTAKLRLVYNTGCGDSVQGPRWLALGADAYVGHPGAHSVSPVFYVYFLRRWLRGMPLEEAVRRSNARTRARIAPFDEALADETEGILFGDGSSALRRLP